ncbi:MAG TPA: hypothetical protein VG406_27805 [Isosphaeraceae bacterium]|jgi:uncharacterized protein (DUF433 family)|nr:hypothetical protein [Isosphaeraceae bacterium]
MSNLDETPARYVIPAEHGGWRLAGSKVSLDSIVYAYWEGRGAEAIQELFPTLSLETIHGAIAYYLRHRAEVDLYLDAQQERWASFRRESEATNAPLLERLRAARGQAGLL